MFKVGDRIRHKIWYDSVRVIVFVTKYEYIIKRPEDNDNQTLNIGKSWAHEHCRKLTKLDQVLK